MSTKAVHRSRRVIAALLVSSVYMVMGCESACNRGAPGKDGDAKVANDIAAVVNGVDIKTVELDTLHKRATDQFTRTGRPLSENLDKNLRGSILRKIIDDELIRQRAEKEGVVVDRIERVDAFEKYKERMGGSKGFQIFLERQNLTEDQVMATVITDLQRDKLIQKLNAVEEPSEQEILSHYKANEKLYTVPEMVRARHILVKLAANEPQEKADLVLKKVQQILAEALQPGASFEGLVQKYSEGPSVKNGGDLGFFQRGRMAKEFEDAAFNAPLKKPVGPIRTDFGYHIIFVEERSEPKVAALEEVRDRIVEFIKRNKRARKSEELLADLRKSAKIVVNDSSMTYEEYKQESERAKITTQTASKDAVEAKK